MELSGEVPLSGRVRLRVRYCECDPMGLAHHSAYLPWLEIGRTELLREAGGSYAAMEAAGYLLVVVRVGLRYAHPARYDEVVEVRTRVAKSTRVKLVHEYEVWRVASAGGEGGEALLMTGETVLACVDREGRVREMPGWLVGLASGDGG